MHDTHSTKPVSLASGDLLDEKETAALLGIAIRTLRNWRCTFKGPRFYKVGKRIVRYRRADLETFIGESMGGPL